MLDVQAIRAWQASRNGIGDSGAALAALADSEPAAEDFLAIATLAEDLSRAVQGCWRDVSSSITGPATLSREASALV